MNEEESKEKKNKKKKSRWIRNSGVSRYSKEEEQANYSLHEQTPPWYHGARVSGGKNGK
jgi:hypothetical protein